MARLRHRGEVQRYQTEIAQIRARLATEFGAGRGWKLSRTDFAPEVLARGGLHGGYTTWTGSFGIDHAFYYRTDQRAVAVAGHPYNVDPDAARTWAAGNGLRVSFPTDWPSWWYPGWTKLVLFERAAA